MFIAYLRRKLEADHAPRLLHTVPGVGFVLRAAVMALIDRLYRLLRLPMPVLSLRTIVIVAALSVVAVVITIGTWVWVGITNDQHSQLDRRLDSLSSLGDVSTLLHSALRPGTDQPPPDPSLVRTVRVDGQTVSVPGNTVLPKFDNGYANTTINGVDYRVRTFATSQGFGGPRRAGGRGPTRDRPTAPSGAADLRRRHRRHLPGRRGDVADHDQPVPAVGLPDRKAY